MPSAVLIQNDLNGAAALRDYCKEQGIGFTSLTDSGTAMVRCQELKPEILFVAGEYYKAHRDFRFPPISFMICSPSGVGAALDGMKHGAFDYILRPVRYEEVAIKMERAMDATRWIERRIDRLLGGIREKKTQLHEVVFAEIERVMIRKVMERTKGNKIQASNLLGINRNTLYSKLRKYKLV